MQGFALWAEQNVGMAPSWGRESKDGGHGMLKMQSGGVMGAGYGTSPPHMGFLTCTKQVALLWSKEAQTWLRSLLCSRLQKYKKRGVCWDRGVKEGKPTLSGGTQATRSIHPQWLTPQKTVFG